MPHGAQRIVSSEKLLCNAYGAYGGLCGIVGAMRPLSQGRVSLRHLPRECSRIMKEPPALCRSRFKVM